MATHIGGFLSGRGWGMFWVSKLLGLFTKPDNALYLLLVVLCAWGFTRWRRQLPYMLAVLVLGLTFIAVAPWNRWAWQPLEDRFPPPGAMPAHVDGIVVLGGSVLPVVAAARGQVAVNDSAERLIALVELGRRYRDARLVFTGGSGSVTFPDQKEAPVARDVLDAVGFDSGRVILEDRSRNTRENAVFSRDLVRPGPGEVWILVTSAAHMPRSVGVFRAIGWPVLPYPVDYHSTGGPDQDEFAFDLHEAQAILGASLHEWVGLLVYRLRGWTDAWFPSP